MAGFMIWFTGVGGAYFAAAGFLLIPLTLYGYMPQLKIARRTHAAYSESWLTSFRGGVSFAIKNPVVRVVLLVSITTMTLAMPFQFLMPLYVTEVLEMGPETLGLIMALPGFLTVGGGLFAASLGDFRYKGRLLFIAVLSPCAACIILSQTSMLWTTIFAACLFGALSSQYGPASQSAIMKATPEELRGRAASLVALAFGLGSVGVMMHGLVADAAGVQMGYLVFGTLALVLNVTYFATMRTYRQMS